MNRRGEIERAMARARIGAAPYALHAQLLRRCGNATGEIPDDKWTPKLGTLARQAKLSRASAFRAVAELARHGWLKRYDTADRAKVAGLLMVGSDCDCAADVAATCERCGASLAHLRRDARYCGDRCSKAARRANASLSSPDMSGIDVGHVRAISRTGGLSSPDNPQVSEPQTDVNDIESSNEREEGELGLPEYHCSVCDEPLTDVGDIAAGAHYECTRGQVPDDFDEEGR